VADVSRTAADSTNSIFDMQISPQFGLIAGAVAAPIALFVTVVRLRDHLRERKDLPYAPWSRSDLLTGCLAVSTVPFALSPSLWAVSALLVIALALALWFGARRTDRVMACSVLTVIALVVAAGGTVHGLLRTDDGLQMSSDMSASLQGLDVEDLKDCVDVYTDGTPTSDLDEADLCMDDGVETYVFPITWECEDGRTLVSNDYGWGFAGDEWTTVGEAPFDRCRSSADRPCADIFVDGEPTREEWTDDYIECFDPDGDIDYVITSRWDCYDSTEVQLSNRYGWGYIGKEWVGSEDAPFC
jgi:hypothetical protein